MDVFQCKTVMVFSVFVFPGSPCLSPIFHLESSRQLSILWVSERLCNVFIILVKITRIDFNIGNRELWQIHVGIAFWTVATKLPLERCLSPQHQVPTGCQAPSWDCPSPCPGYLCCSLIDLYHTPGRAIFIVEMQRKMLNWRNIIQKLILKLKYIWS